MAGLLSWFGDIGKKLHGIEAQINPWDNGENYQSVVNGAPRYQAPQRPQPSRTTPQPSPFNTGVDAFNIPQAVPKPKIDINANAELSKKQNPPQNDWLHNAENAIGGVAKFGGDVVNGIASSVGNTVATLGDMGAKAIVDVTGNDAMKKAANEQFQEHFSKSIPGSIYKPLDTLGTAFGASLAGNDLLNKGYDPNIVTNAINQQTAHVGLNTNNSQLSNDLKIGGAGAETALNIATLGNPIAGSLKEQVGARTGKVLAGDLLKNALAEQAANKGRSLLNQSLRSGWTNGLLGAGSGVAGTIGQDNATLQDYLKNAATGYVGGHIVGAANPYIGATLQKLPRLTTPQVPERILSSKPANYLFGDKQPVIDARNGKIRSSTPEMSVQGSQLLGTRPTPQTMAHEPAVRTGQPPLRSQIQETGMPQSPSSLGNDTTPIETVRGEVYRPSDRSQPPISRQQQPEFAPIPGSSSLPQGQSVKRVPSIPDRPQMQTQSNRTYSNDNITPANYGKLSRYASKTIPESQYVGSEISQQTRKNAPSYAAETERGRYTQTLKSAKQKGFDSFENDVHSRLQGDHIDSQTVSDAQAVAQRLEAKGDDASLRRAADIYDKVSEHLTRSGQTIQAAAIMSRRTPAGMKYQALKDIKKAGVEITPELQRKIGAHTDNISKTKPGSVERQKAIGFLAKEVEKSIPQGTASNLVSVWKAGLLSGVKTTEGNIVSNATFAGLKKLSDPITIAADKAMSFITGKRSATGTQKGVLSGTKEGLTNAKYTMKTGIDLRNAPDKYETRQGINFKNKTVQKFIGDPAQSMFNFLGAQDQPFYYSQLKNSLYDLAKADGLNKGLKGETLLKHMDDSVANPSEHLMQRAVDEANKSVLSYDTFGSKAIRGIHQGIDQFKGGSKSGKQFAHAVVDVLAPFVRVPTAFLSRSIDYTPIGIGKEAISQIANKSFDQRALAKSIGEGLTGTGAIGLGVLLSRSGQLSGDYPSDPKEQARWKAEGIQPNSVKLGDKWVSLNYLGPLGMLFGAGKRFEESSGSGSNAIDSTGAAAAGFGQTLLGQSFLQGFSGFSDAIKDPERNLKSFLNSEVASTVPGLVNDIANLTDNLKRQVNNPGEAVINKIPGLREKFLSPSIDVYGNTTSQGTGLDSLNALKPSSQNHGVVTDEVSRLHGVDPNNKDLQVTPTKVDKTISINKEKVPLNDKQVYDLQKTVGQATQNAWEKLIKSDQYKKLSDTDKAHALNKLRTDITSVAQSKFASDNGLGKIKLSAREQSLANGKASLSNYTSGSTGGSASISDKLDKTSVDVLDKYNGMTSGERDKWFNDAPDAEYKYNLAKFNNDKANGSVNSIESITRQKSLSKEKVGSVYPKTVRDLYGLSKADAYTYLTTEEKGVDKKKLTDQLLAYDKALNGAGLTAYLKYKNGVAPASKGGKKGKKGKKSSGIDQSAIRKLAYSTKVPTYKQPPANGSSIVAPATFKRTALKKYVSRVPTAPKAVAK